jgi:hypothetical protein
MSPDPRYEVRHTESSLLSLQKVPPSMLGDVTRVLADLGGCLKKYPERIFTDRKARMKVYRQPRPLVEIGYRIDHRKHVISCIDIAATPLPSPTKVFVSYSHKDSEFMMELKDWLAVLQQQDRIEFWYDGEIQVGDKWEQKLQEALRSARAALLVVSKDFLVSEYILNKELPVLKAGHEKGTIRIYWLPLRHCLYEGFWFAELQALCNPEVPLEEWQEPGRSKQIKKMCRVLQRQLMKKALSVS